MESHWGAERRNGPARDGWGEEEEEGRGGGEAGHSSRGRDAFTPTYVSLRSVFTKWLLPATIERHTYYIP
jgi:hypothetical protein